MDIQKLLDVVRQTGYELVNSENGEEEGEIRILSSLFFTDYYLPETGSV